MHSYHPSKSAIWQGHERPRADVESQYPMTEQVEVIFQPSNVVSVVAEQWANDRFRNDTLSMAEKKKRRPLTRSIPMGTQLRTIFFTYYLSTMLAPCIPAGFVVYYVHSNPIAAFCVNFAAIAPSAAVLSVATNELKIRSGEKISALLNHTLG
jgi:hypothetical protein